MATVLKNDVHTNIAEIVYNGIFSRTSRAYFFLGKTLAWDEGDSSPPTPNASRLYEAETRANIVSMKNITISDISFAIDRNDWTSGTVYDMYDDRYSSEFPAPSGAQDIADAKMFVLTNEFNIYKCISNNYNSPSTVLPTGTIETGYLEFSDGYVWKYMGSLDVVQRNKFLTPAYMPVSNASSGYYQTGVTPIKVSGGSDYIAGGVTVTVIGDGTGAVLTPDINPTTGEITQLIVTDPGDGYNIATVEIQPLNPQTFGPQGGVGTGANFLLDIQQSDLRTTEVGASAIDGELSFLYVNDGGVGYNAATTEITISGDGQNAQVEAVIVGSGQDATIVGVNFVNRGTGYTFAEVTVTDTSGTGAGAQIDAIVSPSGGHGKNIVKESFAHTLGFQTTTSDEINQGFALENDYRQSGIIFDPQEFTEAGSTAFTFYQAYGSTCYRLNIPDANLLGDGTDINSFSLDQKIYNQTTGEYLVIIAKEPNIVDSAQDGVSLLLQSIDRSVPEIGDIYRTEDNTNLFSVSGESGNIILPEVDKNSGSMIFINNRTPFRKNVEQIVNLRTFIEF